MVASFQNVDDAKSLALARAIVDTMPGALIVLDSDLRVVAASRSFYTTFHLASCDVEGRRLDALSEAWDLLVLRVLLEKIIPEQTSIEDFEVAHEFPGIGHRITLLNAREVFCEHGSQKMLLLSLEDVTLRRAAERERVQLLASAQELLRQKEVLMLEMQHRIANGFQLIASILMLKSHSVSSEETRRHLYDAHRRVLSFAAVQQHLQIAGHGDLIEIGPYLSKLCESLAVSIIGNMRRISLRVACDNGTALSAKAVCLGLIVTELVINALKHAFPTDEASGSIAVSYEADGKDWMLVVADDGIGKPADGSAEARPGLGISIVNALAQQLDARVALVSGASGTVISVENSTFSPRPL